MSRCTSPPHFNPGSASHLSLPLTNFRSIRTPWPYAFLRNLTWGNLSAPKFLYLCPNYTIWSWTRVAHKSWAHCLILWTLIIAHSMRITFAQLHSLQAKESFAQVRLIRWSKPQLIFPFEFEHYLSIYTSSSFHVSHSSDWTQGHIHTGHTLESNLHFCVGNGTTHLRLQCFRWDRHVIMSWPKIGEVSSTYHNKSLLTHSMRWHKTSLQIFGHSQLNWNDFKQKLFNWPK